MKIFGYLRPFFLLFLCVLFSACSSAFLEDKKEVSDAERARMLVQVGNGALIEGDPTGALAYYLKAEAFDAALPELHHSKALAFYAKKDVDAALISAKKAVQLKPDYSDANSTLGKLLLDKGKLREAEEPLVKAAADPTYRNAYKARTNLGILYYRLGKYDQAKRELDYAINSNGDFSCVAYYYRGHLWMRDGQLEKAIQDYDRSVQKFCGNFAEAHYALGVAYTKDKQYERAKKKFLEVQKMYPNSQFSKKAMDHLRYLP